MMLITPNLTSGQRNSHHRLAARWLVLLLLSVSLTNCAGFDVGRLNPTTWFGDDEVNPPTELTKIDVEVTLKREWDAKIGNGQGKIFNLITPVIDGERLFVASADGTVAVFVKRRNVAWRERLEDPITGGGCGAWPCLSRHRSGGSRCARPRFRRYPLGDGCIERGAVCTQD